MISSHDLLLVQRIVELGSLTRAADSLFLTQSAVSHQLKDLEERTGLPVFDRVNKKLVLTHTGRRIMEAAGILLPQLQRLNEDIGSYKNGKVQTLRISTECYTIYHWLPELISSMKKEKGDIDISIVAAATQRPVEYLLRGELDLAIISEPQETNAIDTSPLFTDNLVAVLHRDHPLARLKRSLTAADFEKENLITYDVRTGYNQFAHEFFREKKPGQITRMQLTEAIVEMINAGMGIGIFATWAIIPYLAQKQLVTLPLRSPFKKRIWRAAWVNKRHPLIPDFIARVKEYFR